MAVFESVAADLEAMCGCERSGQAHLPGQPCLDVRLYPLTVDEMLGIGWSREDLAALTGDWPHLNPVDLNEHVVSLAWELSDPIEDASMRDLWVSCRTDLYPLDDFGPERIRQWLPVLAETSSGLEFAAPSARLAEWMADPLLGEWLPGAPSCVVTLLFGYVIAAGGDEPFACLAARAGMSMREVDAFVRNHGAGPPVGGEMWRSLQVTAQLAGRSGR